MFINRYINKTSYSCNEVQSYRYFPESDESIEGPCKLN